MLNVDHSLSVMRPRSTTETPSGRSEQDLLSLQVGEIADSRISTRFS